MMNSAHDTEFKHITIIIIILYYYLNQRLTLTC